MYRGSLPRFALRLAAGLALGALAATPADACGCGKETASLTLYTPRLASLGPLVVLLAALLALALASYAALRSCRYRHARPLLVATLVSTAVVGSYVLAYRLTLLVARRGDFLDNQSLFGYLFLYSALLLAPLGLLLLGGAARLTRQTLAGKWYLLTALATPTLWNVLGLLLAVASFQLLGWLFNVQSEHALFLSWWASALGLGTLVSYRRALALAD